MHPSSTTFVGSPSPGVLHTSRAAPDRRAAFLPGSEIFRAPHSVTGSVISTGRIRSTNRLFDFKQKPRYLTYYYRQLRVHARNRGARKRRDRWSSAEPELITNRSCAPGRDGPRLPRSSPATPWLTHSPTPRMAFSRDASMCRRDRASHPMRLIKRAVSADRAASAVHKLARRRTSFGLPPEQGARYAII